MMARMLSATLANPTTDDPGLLVTLQNRSEAYLLDCGSLARLRHRDLQRVRRVFVTHTHIDHFIGFDHLVRMQLVCPHVLDVYGPPGMLDHVRGKLSGYAWNLVDTSPFYIRVNQLHPDRVESTLMPCKDRFRPAEPSSQAAEDGLPLAEGLRLRWTPVEHNVVCLAYSLQANTSWRVDRAALAKLGHPPGPWLSQLKTAAEKGQTEPDIAVGSTAYRAGELIEKLLRRQQGRKLSYVTDTVFNKRTVPALTQLVRHSDELWCEASYLSSERDKAREHLHMTARQAARLALEAEVASLRLMHLSRRYEDDQAHLAEARAVFAQTVPAAVYA